MRDVTPVAPGRGGDASANRSAQDKADAQLLHDRVTVAFGDHYIIEEEVGRGGMAVVYAATDVRLQRKVALKVLPPDLAFRSDVRERFVREAQTAARLNHPHIVPIYAVHEEAGLVCFAMALVTGESLAARITRDPRPPFEYIGTMLEQVADALAYAHASGVVHRDIKPDNVLIDRESGRAMVTDFGIARAAESGSRLTQTGIAVGTPAFMSPEQATGEREIDGRSDIYSLGVVGYLMLAGRLPFEASTTPAMLVKHLSETPPPIWSVRPDAPRALADILERCLAKRPADRWENALALRDSLRIAVRTGFGRSTGGSHGSAGRFPAVERPADRPADRPNDASRNLLREAAERAAADRAAREHARRYGSHHDDWAPRPVAPDPSRNGAAYGALNAGVNGAPARIAVLPPMAPVPPLSPDATKREVREWQRAVRDRRQEQKQRWKIERGAQREAIDDESMGSTPEDRIRRFRFKVIRNVLLMIVLTIINAATAGFPWVIFPIFGITAGLIGDYARLRSRGVRLRHVMLGAPSNADDAMPPKEIDKGPLPQRIQETVLGFRRHLKWFAGSAAVAATSLVIGMGFDFDPMAVPFVAGLGFGGISAGMSIRDWLRLRSYRVTASDALGEGWRERARLADTRTREQKMREELARIASDSLLTSSFGATIRAAVDDRMTIRETSERLSDADRALVPDVEPTADALLERIGALASGLERLESDLPGNALPELDARIKVLEAEPEHAPDRERRLSLLARQRASLADLDDRRVTMQRQLENATLALRSLRLDMVKLRTLGVGAAIGDVTSATQEARALSRDIGRAVEAADELRNL